MTPDTAHVVVIVVLVLLNLAAAVLPIIGLFRLARRAWGTLREAQTDDPGQNPGIHITTPDGREASLSWGTLFRGAEASSSAPGEGWREARWDVGLVGSGIVLGAVANIWSLFV